MNAGRDVEDTTPTANGEIFIDDLLRHEEAEPPPRRARMVRSYGWVPRTAVLAAALAALLLFVLRVYGIGLPYTVAFAGAFALMLLRRLVRAVRPVPLPRARGGGDPGVLSRSTDGLRRAVIRWETRLDWAHHDADRFTRTVLPVLRELVDERLRQRHGLTRAGDPRRTRELLGDELWEFLAGPPTRPPSPRRLGALLARVEKL